MHPMLPFRVQRTPITLHDSVTLPAKDRATAARIWSEALQVVLAEREHLSVCDGREHVKKRRRLRDAWATSRRVAGARYDEFRAKWMAQNRSDSDLEEGTETHVLYARDPEGHWVGGIMLYNMRGQERACPLPGFLDITLSGPALRHFLTHEIALEGGGTYALQGWRFPTDNPDHRWTLSVCPAILKSLEGFERSWRDVDGETCIRRIARPRE